MILFCIDRLVVIGLDWKTWFLVVFMGQNWVCSCLISPELNCKGGEGLKPSELLNRPKDGYFVIVFWVWLPLVFDNCFWVFICGLILCGFHNFWYQLLWNGILGWGSQPSKFDLVCGWTDLWILPVNGFDQLFSYCTGNISWWAAWKLEPLNCLTWFLWSRLASFSWCVAEFMWIWLPLKCFMQRV